MRKVVCVRERVRCVRLSVMFKGEGTLPHTYLSNLLHAVGEVGG